MDVRAIGCVLRQRVEYAVNAIVIFPRQHLLLDESWTMIINGKTLILFLFELGGNSCFDFSAECITGVLTSTNSSSLNEPVALGFDGEAKQEIASVSMVVVRPADTRGG